jgi:ATP-dependent Clp protease ATP-binding subunit ClpA
VFERFTEDARHALFFARAKAAERQGDVITPEDFLAGILLSAPHVMTRLGGRVPDMPTETAEDFMERSFSTIAARTSKEIPFSQETKTALGRAAEEADELGHKPIRPEHLLLGILRDESSEAWRTLHEAGVTLREARRMMRDEQSETEHEH